MGYWHHFCHSPPVLFQPSLPSRKELQRIYPVVKEWLCGIRIFVQNVQEG